MLLERHHIRHDLAGMRLFGQAIDDRYRCIGRQLVEAVVIENADHDRIDIARQHLGGIGDGLAATELHFLAGQHQRFAAELAHADIERHARPRRRPLEDHRQHLAGQRTLSAQGVAPLCLHAAAGFDDLAQLRTGDFGEVEEVLVVRGKRHAAAP